MNESIIVPTGHLGEVTLDCSTIGYCKENSILQLPVFYFGRDNRKKIVISWESEAGKCSVECYCDYGLPGALEQDVFAACMKIWVNQGMSLRGVQLQYSDIARELRLDPKKMGTKIKNAMRRLALAKYVFKNCFITKEESTYTESEVYLNLFDAAEFVSTSRRGRKKNKNWVKFPEKIRNNLTKKYYQWLDLDLYLKLDSGLPRRLYEYLEKRRYHNIKGTFSISEDLLCRWLPIIDRHTTKRRKRLAKAVENLKKNHYLSQSSFDKKRKIWHFQYIAKKQQKKIPTASTEKPAQSCAVAKIKAVKNMAELAGQRNKDQLLALTNYKRPPKTAIDLIEQYLASNGYAYVAANITYTNANAKRSYGGFLRLALEKDYAAAKLADTEAIEHIKTEQQKEHDRNEEFWQAYRNMPVEQREIWHKKHWCEALEIALSEKELDNLRSIVIFLSSKQ